MVVLGGVDDSHERVTPVDVMGGQYNCGCACVGARAWVSLGAEATIRGLSI